MLQPSIEMLWAMKAYEHAEIYFNVSFVKSFFLGFKKNNARIFFVYLKTYPLLSENRC